MATATLALAPIPAMAQDTVPGAVTGGEALPPAAAPIPPAPAAGAPVPPVAAAPAVAGTPPATEAAAEAAAGVTDISALTSCVPSDGAFVALSDEFVRGPDAFYDRFVSRGASLAVPTRNVLVVRPAEIDTVIGLMRAYGFDTDEARQIAVGIGQAALMCANVEPEAAAALQERMAAIDSAAVQLAFSAATGDIATAALAGAGAGGGGNTAGPAVSGSALTGSANSGADEGTANLFRQGATAGSQTRSVSGVGNDGNGSNGNTTTATVLPPVVVVVVTPPPPAISPTTF